MAELVRKAIKKAIIEARQDANDGRFREGLLRSLAIIERLTGEDPDSPEAVPTEPKPA